MKNLIDFNKTLAKLKSIKVEFEKLQNNLDVFLVEDKIMMGELLDAAADEISSISSMISSITHNRV